METEFPFTLPRGYVDAEGRVHREGVMRLARAGDEIEPLEDPRVHANRAYLVVLLLGRVITRLGDLEEGRLGADVVEGLFAGDLAYLQRFYRKINGLGGDAETRCPHCGRALPEEP